MDKIKVNPIIKKDLRVTSRSMKLAWELFAYVAILGIIFIGSLFHYSIQLVQRAVQFTPILKISTRWLYACIPVNCAIMLIYLVRDAVVNVKKVIGK